MNFSVLHFSVFSLLFFVHFVVEYVLKRPSLFLTFGSPLDKTAFIFRTQKKNAIVREALAAAKQPMIQTYEYRPPKWINLWSRNDWISGSLESYDHPDPSQGGSQRVVNRIDKEAHIPLMAHTQYWKNKALAEVLYRAAVGLERENEIAG